MVPQGEDTSSDQDALQHIPHSSTQPKESLGNTSVPRASALQVKASSSLPNTVYRVQGIPSDYNANMVVEALNTVLGLRNSRESLQLGSLATSPYRPEKVATISFKDTPMCLLKGDEWCYDISDSRQPDSHNIDRLPRTSIVIDSHFRGFTPLRTFELESDHKTE